MIVRAGAFPPPEQKFAYSESACQRTMPEKRSIPTSERFLAAFQQLTLGVFRDLRRAPDPAACSAVPGRRRHSAELLQDASRAD